MENPRNTAGGIHTKTFRLNFVPHCQSNCNALALPVMTNQVLSNWNSNRKIRIQLPPVSFALAELRANLNHRKARRTPKRADELQRRHRSETLKSPSVGLPARVYVKQPRTRGQLSPTHRLSRSFTPSTGFGSTSLFLPNFTLANLAVTLACHCPSSSRIYSSVQGAPCARDRFLCKWFRLSNWHWQLAAAFDLDRSNKLNPSRKKSRKSAGVKSIWEESYQAEAGRGESRIQWSLSPRVIVTVNTSLTFVASCRRNLQGFSNSN